MLLATGSRTTLTCAGAPRCHRTCLKYKQLPSKNYAVSQIQHNRIETHQPGPIEQSPAAQLLQWAASNGVVVHPALMIVDEAPCGSRGVVAAEDIDMASCQRLWSCQGALPVAPPTNSGIGPPLLAVPERLSMSSTDALHLLSQALHQPAGSVVTKKPRGSAQLHTACASSSSPEQVYPYGTEHSDHSTTPFAHSGLRIFHRAVQQLLSALGIHRGSHADDLHQRLQQLQPPVLLALLLAHQRRLDHKSFWGHYIEALPAKPPCAWYDTVLQMLLYHNPTANDSTAVPWSQRHEQDSNTRTSNQSTGLDDALHASSAPINSRVLVAAAEAVAAKCKAAAELFGSALGGITAADVAWAYGQVVSRAFGVGGSDPPALALLPIIDMLNHTSGAAVPVCCDLPRQADLQGGQQWAPTGDTRSQEQAADADADAEGGDQQESGYWCVWHSQTSGWHEQEAIALAAVSSCSGANHRDCDASLRAAGSAEGQVESGAAADKVIMHKGQELYVSYLSSCDANAAYLSFGFVPPEAVEELKQA